MSRDVRRPVGPDDLGWGTEGSPIHPINESGLVRESG